MMKLVLYLALFGMVTGCNAKNTDNNNESAVAMEEPQSQLKNNGHVLITGNIANAAGKQVFLQTVPQQTPGKQPQMTLIDTSVVQPDGSFVLEGTIDQKHIALLGLDNQHLAYLVLDGGTHQFTSDYMNFNNYTITNSPESQEMKKFLETVSGNFNQINQMEMQLRNATAAQAEAIRDQQHQIYDNTFEYIKNYIDTSDNEIISLFAADILDLNTEYDFIKKYAQSVSNNYSNSKYYQHLNAKLQDHESVLGQQAPDIKLPTPDGDSLALSDLRGKVVLLDFWAAWCGPCRRENPNVVRLYDEFNDEGFTVFSVSLDKDRQKWVDAIKADNLKWDNHVSELLFWQGKAHQQYGVNSIPATFLLNEEGKIIAKNLRGYFLEKKLEQLLGD